MSTCTRTDPSTRVVVITGCDTGFGAEIVEALHKQKGYTIYATCLTQEAVSRYSALKSPLVRASIVNVTKQEDVDRLQSVIEAECPQGVYCLFNNAGIVAGSFFDFTSLDDFQKMMDVNYMGVIRLIKGLLPSMRTYARSRHTAINGMSRPRARIVTITSVAGRTPITGHNGYCDSKHATECLIDTLRPGLAPWEIDLSIIEPWYAKTPIIDSVHNALEGAWKRADSTTQKMFGGQQFAEGVVERGKMLHKLSMPSQWVVDVALHTICDAKGASKPRRMVGYWWLPLFVYFFELGPSWLVDWAMKMSLKQSNIWPTDPFLLKAGKDDKCD